jgi:ubiquinone/menaquinone biosynthesis C-methylase UbiE
LVSGAEPDNSERADQSIRTVEAHLSAWKEKIDQEVDFWRKWLTKEEFREARDARLYNPDHYINHLLARIGNPPEPRVLDVGSGPISTFYAAAKRDNIELRCADALGEHYARLLTEASLDGLPDIVPVKGEALTTRFPLNSFDLVHCANALDHFEDPFEGFWQMMLVCKVRGAVTIVSIENEGERENYCGLHQWNLRADDEGFWLSSRDSNTVNLIDRAIFEHYEWQYVNPPDAPFRVFEVVAVKGHTASSLAS